MKNLLAKSLLGFAFLIGVLALALFGSAGTLAYSLAYWQAWAYLAVFGRCSLLITVYLFVFGQQLLASRAQVGPVAESERSQQVIQSVASPCFISL